MNLFGNLRKRKSLIINRFYELYEEQIEEARRENFAF